MDYKKCIQTVYDELKDAPKTGFVSNTIPELQKIDSDKFGMHIVTLNGTDFGVGDSNEKFSIQSISKALTLALAFTFVGEKLWTRVGVEPSGSAFNSLIQLEYEKGIPRNPFINAGALVIADVLVSHLKNPKDDLLAFIRKITGNSTINFNEKVAQSEKEFGFRNNALAYFLKSFGNINNDVTTVLDFYFHQCAIELTCKELAHCFYFFANSGKTKFGQQVLTSSEIKRLNAVMQTCGFYDESGEFTYRVGLPGKSGIGGGIVALFPKNYVVATWSPRLNEKGNSVLGMQALEKLTTITGLSVF